VTKVIWYHFQSGLIDFNHVISISDKIKKIKQKSFAVLKHSVICMTHLIGILIDFTYY